MAQFTDLPNELLLHVARYLGPWEDLVHLATINRHSNDVVGALILRYLTELRADTILLAWLIENQNVHGVKKALRYGVSPNHGLDPAAHDGSPDPALPRHSHLLRTHLLTYRRAAGHRMSGVPACDFPRSLRLDDGSEGTDIYEAGRLPPRVLYAYRKSYSNSTFSLLHHAAKQGNTDIIQLLLDHGADIHALSLDIQGGSVMAAKTLLPCQKEASPLPPSSRRPRVRYTPLHSAILAYKTSAAKLLLEAGASPNSCILVDNSTSTDWMVPTTALHLAAFLGNKDLIEYLLKNGHQSVNERDEFDSTPIVYATVGHNLSAVGEQLLEKGSDPNTLITANCPLLTEACWHGRFGDALVLLDHGADLEHSGRCMVKPLHLCCVRKTEPLRMICGPTLNLCREHSQESMRLELVKRLIRSGTNLHERVELPGLDDIATPLLLAIDSGLIDVVKELVAYGADINVPEIPRCNALLAALSADCDEQSKFDTVSYILDLEPGCDVSEVDEYGRSPLHVLGSLDASGLPRFTSAHEEQLGRRLLRKGANVHARDGPYGPSLFPAFCKLGSYRFCSVLADHGAAYSLSPVELNVIFRKLVESVAKAHDTAEAIPLLGLLLSVDRTGTILGDSNCFEVALSEGAIQIAQHLLQSGCSYSAKDKFRGYVLHRACEVGATGIVELLLDRGADVNESLDWCGRLDRSYEKTTLQIAMKYAYRRHIVTNEHQGQQLLKTLLRRGATWPHSSTATTLIQKAICRNQVEVLNLALERWRPLADEYFLRRHSEPNKYFTTLLFSACDSSNRICNPEIICSLLRHLLPIGFVVPHTVEGTAQDHPQSKEHKSFLGWLVCTYKPLAFCPGEDCDCGDNLLRSIIVLLSGGKLSTGQAYTPEARQLLKESHRKLVAVLKDATLQMDSRVLATGLGGRGRSTRHCLEFIMDKLELSSTDLRDSLPRLSFLDTVL
ncbi:ankyrin repeat-containing domain protein [Truncatella angustata]|uniref:Ankyrin repeat-containing domain protein n=1 Tax=Truncatella angustata TaxID=152316 RepID=A0A9P8UQB7_9PEZI|nr:ankyrin repeat-containing domain protein [Truncatella angustata]KAH6656274.1 ankyrin repeat-containing domain protein [Truncatella angustata]KAH8199457.1 hypothetical protein TruAng_006395 [Truncatella angustata]